MKIKELFEGLNEALVMGKYHDKPLKDNDTLRVYHGCSVETAYVAVTRGLTGGVRVDRTYSYENNNNPKGLFVTPHMRVAKEFGVVILEFHTKIRDLEAPVWPSGGYTGQGQMSSYFSDDDDRTRAALQQRLKLSDHEYDYVRDSDRPDVAYWMLAVGESQALFKGGLNRNSIRSVWIRENPRNSSSPFKRMTPRDFIALHKQEGIPEMNGRPHTTEDLRTSSQYKNASTKLIKPRDVVSGEEFIRILNRKFPHLDRDELVDIVQTNNDYIRRFVWSDQQYNTIHRDVMRM